METYVTLFCYGTLKQGKHNHDYLETATFLGEAHTSSDYTLVVSGLPYLIERKGAGCYGELYKIDKKTLKLLDKLEGHPGMYRRVSIIVYDLETAYPIQCEAYLYPDVFQNNVGQNYEIVRCY